MLPRILSIAGSDSGAGAGIQADLKTCAALGAYGLNAVTAITAQNTLGVQDVHPIPPHSVQAQIQSVIEDIGVDAVKTGMLGALETVNIVSQCLHHYAAPNIVVDPVLISTSGTPLLSAQGASALLKTLFPLATLVTPNLPEASWLLNRSVLNQEDMINAVHMLQTLGCKAVLLKGGHLNTDELTDVLLCPDGKVEIFKHPRIETTHLHGTGCTLSTAIACYLGAGADLVEAVRGGLKAVTEAIIGGKNQHIGQGNGPLGHQAIQPMPIKI